MAIKILLSSKNHSLFEQIENRLQFLATNEQQLLNLRENQYKSDVTRNSILTFGAFVFAFFLGLTIYYFLQRDQSGVDIDLCLLRW